MNSIILTLGQTHTNYTRCDQTIVLNYINAVGEYQTHTEELKPGQSITKTQPLNKVRIIF